MRRLTYQRLDSISRSCKHQLEDIERWLLQVNARLEAANNDLAQQKVRTSPAAPPPRRRIWDAPGTCHLVFFYLGTPSFGVVRLQDAVFWRYLAAVRCHLALFGRSTPSFGVFWPRFAVFWRWWAGYFVPAV